SMDIRMAAMTGALKEMNEVAKRAAGWEKFEPGIYAGDCRLIDDLWQTTVASVNPGYTGAFQFGDPYDTWFKKVYAAVYSRYRKYGFSCVDWDSASKLSE